MFGLKVRQTLTCDEQGFRYQWFDKSSIPPVGGGVKGQTVDETYGWREVTDTQYFEEADTDINDRRVTHHSFKVLTARGEAFTYSEPAASLIEIINEMTPNVAHVWMKQKGSVKSWWESKEKYQRVDRPAAAATG
jgi:hypothetical protein